ncbi:hypothetical protein MUK42_33804 [Musa troglodytarum]|uniref:Uncharacterized protein n=1 Tax=Musa troglodytarum TaxID=320322 RepID=A0A9E7F2F2_9LILI|nr:hypothetical protein MUK42_33804 [Musa troglodytarum]
MSGPQASLSSAGIAGARIMLRRRVPSSKPNNKNQRLPSAMERISGPHLVTTENGLSVGTNDRSSSRSHEAGRDLRRRRPLALGGPPEH